MSDESLIERLTRDLHDGDLHVPGIAYTEVELDINDAGQRVYRVVLVTDDALVEEA